MFVSKEVSLNTVAALVLTLCVCSSCMPSAARISDRALARRARLVSRVRLAASSDDSCVLLSWRPACEHGMTLPVTSCASYVLL